MAKKSRSEAGAELAKSLLGNMHASDRVPGTVAVPAMREGTPEETDVANRILHDAGFELPPPDLPDFPTFEDSFIPEPEIDLTNSSIPPDDGTRVPTAAAPTDHAPPPLFVVPDGMGGVAPDIAKIVLSIYEIDASRDYQDIEKSLEIGDERTGYAVLMQHLDKGEARARRAHALYLGAKLELAKFDIDSQKVVGAMRSKASEVLEGEKADGTRKKAITNADIEAQMADMFPDEWAAQELTRVRMKGAVEHLERLADLTKGRCHTLGTMLSNLRK